MSHLTKKQLSNGIVVARVQWSKYDVSKCSKNALVRLPKAILQGMYSDEQYSSYSIPRTPHGSRIFKRDLNGLNTMDIVYIKTLSAKLELCAYFNVLSQALREIPLVHNYHFFEAVRDHELYKSGASCAYACIHVVNFKSFYSSLSQQTGLYDILLESRCPTFIRRDIMTNVTYLHKNRINSLISELFKLKLVLRKLK